jgi:hypothetical protein
VSGELSTPSRRVGSRRAGLRPATAAARGVARARASAPAARGAQRRLAARGHPLFDEATPPPHHWIVSGLQLLVALAIMIAAPRLAESAIYAWQDAQGTTHYVDNLDNVPPEHRGTALLLVKDWQRTAPPAEDVAPPPAVPMGPSADAVSEAVARGFEEGMWAGRESATPAERPPANVVLGPIVQNVEVLAPPHVVSTFPGFISTFPVFEPVLPPKPHRRRVSTAPVPHRFISGPAGEPPFGAAGPPPIGAAGPPPISFVRQ